MWTVRWAGPASLAIIAVLYMFVNLAYFAARKAPNLLPKILTDACLSVPKQEIQGANTIAASLFFAKVFGSGSAARSLNILILLSAFGNLVSQLEYFPSIKQQQVPSSAQFPRLPYLTYLNQSRCSTC